MFVLLRIFLAQKNAFLFKSLRLWEEVKVDESIGKDSVLCGATVSACARAGQWQRAMQLLKEVEASWGRCFGWLLTVGLIFRLLMASLSYYLHGFIHPWWCRISSINSIDGDD